MRSLYSYKLRGEYDPTIADLKRDVVDRIRNARKDGVTYGALADAAGEKMGIHIVCDIMNAEVFGKEIWEAMDEGLKKLGY